MTDMTGVEYQKLQVRFDELKEEVVKSVRRLDTMQKSLDLLYKDRDILEDLLAQITQLKSLVVTNREHQANALQEVKTEVRDTKDSVQSNMDNLVDSLDQRKVVVVKENLLNKLLKNVFRSK